MQIQRSAIRIDSIARSRIRPRTVRLERVGDGFRQGLLAALVCLAAAAPVTASPLELAALVEPASQEHHAGKVVFVELVTPDLAAAKRFYAALFGWTFRDVEIGGTRYAEAALDGRPVAGLIHKEMRAGERRQPAWLSFIAVRDVDRKSVV